MPFAGTRVHETIAKSAVLKVAESGVAIGSAVTVGRVADIINKYKTLKDKADQEGFPKPYLRENSIEFTIQDVDDAFETEVLQKLDGKTDCTWILEYNNINKTTFADVPYRMIITKGGFSVDDGDEPFDGKNVQGLKCSIKFNCHPKQYSALKAAVEP